MKSRTTKRFRKCLSELPDEVRKQARQAYSHFVEDPYHPGLRFKKVILEPRVYSVRITRDYRALGVLEKENIITWFWIGSLKTMRESWTSCNWKRRSFAAVRACSWTNVFSI